MSAIKEGSSEEYDMSSDMFMQLAESGDTLSNVHHYKIIKYLVGK